MNPLLVIAIPVVLIILGMILNSLDLSFSQPSSSQEQDPTKRLDAERQAYNKFFDLQRTRFLKRQSRVGQYSWLVLITVVVAFLWIYFDTVNKTAAANQIASIQTVATEEGKETVLSVTLIDRSNVKYLVKLAKADPSDGAPKDGISKSTISSWEVSKLKTAFSRGKVALPLGIDLRISD